MIKIIVFIVFINVFMSLIFIKIINKIKDFKKSFAISLKHCITVIKQFKSLVTLRLMFITLKTYSCLIFFNIKMYSSLNLIVNEKIKIHMTFLNNLLIKVFKKIIKKLKSLNK